MHRQHHRSRRSHRRAGYSETGTPGSEGGRAEKDQPNPLAPRRAADPTRTMCDEWLYSRPFTNGQDRADALPGWLHTYNYHRAHTALGGRPPITRVNNGPGHYN